MTLYGQDEILELLWTLREDGKASRAELLGSTADGVTILLLSKFGIPVSTTHAITGSIVGVGATRRLSAVRWGVATRIVWAWLLTIPASAGIGAGTYALLRLAGIN